MQPFGVIVLSDAVAGLIGVVISALLGFAGVVYQVKRRKDAEDELDVNAKAMRFAEQMIQREQIQLEITNLFNTSEADRFLLLIAINGKADPKTTTAVMQMRSGAQDYVSYFNFILDQDYKDRLNRIRADGSAHWKVSDMPPCSIKSVYEAEGVRDTVWLHVHDEEMPDGRCAIVYASMSTHEPAGFTPETVTRIRTIRGAIKAWVEFYYKQ